MSRTAAFTLALVLLLASTPLLVQAKVFREDPQFRPQAHLVIAAMPAFIYSGLQELEQQPEQERLFVVTTPGAKVLEGKRQGEVLQVGSVFAFTEVRNDRLYAPALGGWVNQADTTPYDEAFQFFNAAIGKDPGNPMLHFGRGKLLFWMGSHGRLSVQSKNALIVMAPSDFARMALAEFGETIRLDPNHAEAIRARAETFLMLESVQEAIADCDRLVQLKKDDASAYLMRCRALGLRGSWEKALADCNQAVKLAPKLAEAYKQRGEIWDGKNKVSQAMADYAEAIRLGDINARILRSRHYYEQGKFKECLADLDAAIAAQPEVAGHWGKRGFVRLETGELDGAIADFTKSLELDLDPVVLTNRGSAWTQKNELDKALADFTAAIDLAPDMAASFLNRGRLYGTLGDHVKASADLSEYLALEPQDWSAYALRGIAYYFAKEHDRAIKDLDKAIRHFPNEVDLYIFRGSALNYQGRYDRAIIDFDRAIALDPKQSEAFNYRGVAWMQKNVRDKSLADFNRAIQLDSNSQTAYQNRANLLSLQGEFAKAAADFQRAFELAPKDTTILSNYSWLLATAPDDKVRNGKRAVEMALQVCEVAGWDQPGLLENLAAAYAESGDFENAIKWQTKVVALLKEDSAEEAARLELYRNHQPYHQEPGPKSDSAGTLKSQDSTPPVAFINDSKPAGKRL
jgi:tetratricopeptide (TPR) repeat protein